MESGLVIVVPVKKTKTSPWAFLKPFTIEMWLVTGGFFLLVGLVVWILEHRLNHEFRGPPSQQIITIFWFSFSTMFFSHSKYDPFILKNMFGFTRHLKSQSSVFNVWINICSFDYQFID